MSWLCFSLSPFLILSLESSLSLSFRLRRRQFKCQTSKKPLFRGVNRPLGKSSLALSFSHTNTLLRIKPHSRTKLTLYFSLSLVSLCRTPSSRLTYISLSLSLSLSVSFSSRHQSLNLSLSFIRNDCINSSKTIFLLTLKTQTKTKTTTLSLSLWLPLVLLFLQQFLEK